MCCCVYQGEACYICNIPLKVHLAEGVLLSAHLGASPCFCSGHALLVGVGGSGKQSLARLSGFICGYATYTIVISGNYNMNNFREDLQKMYKRAGVKVSSQHSSSCVLHMCNVDNQSPTALKARLASEERNVKNLLTLMSD